jgi:hypothetical protein
MAFHYSPKVTTDSLILCLDAGNIKSYPLSGTAWSDISKRENSGTLTNGPTFSSSNSGVIAFDGVDDCVLLPQSTINQTVGNYSFSVWFSFTSTQTSVSTSNYMLMEAQNTLLGGVDNYLYKLSNASVPGTNGRIGFQTFNPLSILYTTTNSWIGGRWYNIVCTYNISNSRQSIYVNGVLENFTTIASCYFNTNTYFTLGAYTSPPRTWFLNGRISRFDVYSKTLSDGEVLQNYNSMKTRFN